MSTTTKPNTVNLLDDLITATSRLSPGEAAAFRSEFLATLSRRMEATPQLRALWTNTLASATYAAGVSKAGV